MAINIKTNLPSLVAQRNVDLSSERLKSSYARLASGLRINRASDDAAGLAIAESLKADSAIATVAIRNANDGISVVAIADQAIGQIGSILSRLAELAEQSANGVFDTLSARPFKMSSPPSQAKLSASRPRPNSMVLTC